MVDRGIALRIVLATTLAGCHSWQPVSDIERRTLAERQPSESAAIRLEAELSMRSAELDGNFRCLIAADYGLSPRVRVQLYPDIGAKILDLVATDQELIGFVADGSTRLEVSAGRTAPRNFLTCLALTLLEAHRLVTPSMIVGRREIGPVTWYRLNTGWPDHALVQTSTSDLVERQHGYGWVRWTEALDPETGQRRITAPEFELTVTIVSIERETSPLPDVLFTLRLPAMDAS